MTSKTRKKYKKKYGKLKPKSRYRIRSRYKSFRKGGGDHIIEDSIIQFLTSTSPLNYDLKTGKLFDVYSTGKPPDPHFNNKLNFIKKFFKGDKNGEFKEIPDLMEDVKNLVNVTDTATVKTISTFLDDHAEYIKDYDGFTELNSLFNVVSTDYTQINKLLAALKQSIEDNKFTYYVKKFANDMKYKFNSDIRKVDEEFANMVFEFNKKYNKEYIVDATITSNTKRKIATTKHETSIRTKHPISSK